MGGQDELVFDGGSFAVGADGEICVQAESFEESCIELVVDAARPGFLAPGHVVEAKTDLAAVWDALVLGLRDYVDKNGFPGWCLAYRVVLILQ